jgi:hypothetical protein
VGVPAALWGVDGLPVMALDGDVEQREKRRQQRPERLVQREELACHLLPDLAVFILVLNAEVALEEVVIGRYAVAFP